MTNCDDVRDHLETCEDCRLHVVVEARLRTQPVLEPPKGMVSRAMKALPRQVPMRREFFRLAAAAAMLLGLTAGAFAAGLDTAAPVLSVKERTARAFEATSAVINSWRSDPWKE